MLANDAAMIAYLASQKAITPHPWTSRADRLERPDRLVFDLDPAIERGGAKASAPVATPLCWEELDDRRLDPRGWTIATICDRLAERPDPWRDIARHARTVGPPARALERR